MKSKTSAVLLQTPLISLVFLFVFFMYTFLHESGHAMAGLLFGQSLTEFNVSFWDFSAHVDMAGGELSQAQLAVQAAAGAGLPILIWAMFMTLVPRKANFALEVLKLMSSLTVINTLLVWIILPILFVFGRAPSDDVTHFLLLSEMSPLLLLCLASILYFGGWVFFLSKIDGLRKEFLLFRNVDRDALITGTRSLIPAMAGIAASCVALTLALNHLASINPLDQFSPPQDFVPVARIDLSGRAYSAETLAQFSLAKPMYVGVFVNVQDINTTYFDLSVTGPDGFNSIVLHGEGYSADQDGGLWEENLLPGAYQLVLTSHQSPGSASVYLKTPDSK